MKKGGMVWLWTLLILSSVPVKGQELQWVSFEQLADSLRAEPKPLLIFIHTDWCKYCAMQEQNTFGDPAVIKTLNEHFYCLRLNAESQTSIRFLNRMYSPKPKQQGYHSLATFLGQEKGTLGFPTTLLLTAEMQAWQRFVGVLTADELLEYMDKSGE